MDIQKKILEAEGGQLSYYVSGKPDGAPVILMHGWGCNHTTLQSIASVLEPYRKVYNVDFPGFGSSPEPPEVWGVNQYSVLIEKLIDLEGIKQPILLGHSFGGRVAIVLGSRRKDIDKIILVDAAGVKPKRSMNYYLKIYGYKFSKWLTRKLYGEEKAKKIVESRLAKRASSDYLAASTKMRAVLSKVVNEDLRHLMPEISAPTLLVWGEKDTATPLQDAHIMEKLIPDAGLVVFEGCGHYSFLDNPFKFSAVLRSFID